MGQNWRTKHHLTLNKFRMVLYPITLQGMQPLFAMVAAHGLTDLDSVDWILPYALWCFVPNTLVTPGFVASSILHFSFDVGRVGTLLVHLAAGVAWLTLGQHVAFRCMLLYLGCVHVPLHYKRCLKRNRILGVRLALVATVIMTACSGCIGHTLFFNNWMQRFAAAHIAHEFALQMQI
jgi:hypothetical protein